MSIPIVVTHSSSLLHDGLRRLFAKSAFKPTRIATLLTEDLEEYLKALGDGVWLTGIETSIEATNAVLRQVVAANPDMKVVILAATHNQEDVVAALQAGASGFLDQDVSGDTLLRSLELIAHGKMVVHPQLAAGSNAGENSQMTHQPESVVARGANGESRCTPSVPMRSSFSAAIEQANGNVVSNVPSLSRREILILRMLMQGASNKVIARTLVITESTVKVHMKAILRKLRLNNRTQAALWARNHVGDAAWTSQAGGESAH